MDSLCFSPDIVVLTETWFDENRKYVDCIASYNSFHTVREYGRGGGVSIFVSDRYECALLDDLCVSNDTIESCSVKINMHGESIVILGIYRPHTDTVLNFTQELGRFLESNTISGYKVCVTGDFNVNLLNSESTDSMSLVNLLQSNHFIPVITKPTRFPPNNSLIEPTLLDHMWFNCLDIYSSGIFLFDMTDHCPVFSCFSHGASDEPKFVKVRFRLLNDELISNFVSRLEGIDWNFSERGDVNVQVAYFIDMLNDIYCKCFPLKVKNISLKRLKKPWLTPAILNSIKTKSKYFKLYKLGIIDKVTNNRYKNCVNDVIRRAKCNYYGRLFTNCTDNIKKSWNLINDLMCRSHNKQCIKSIVVNDGVIDSEGEMAESFNSFFSSVAANLERDMPPGDGMPPHITPVRQSFYLFPVTHYELVNIISKLKNKKTDLNDISVDMFKRARHVLSEPLLQLINNCFETGIFPDILKIASITPIYKKGDRCTLTNYRPISILPLLSKILEKVIAVRITSWLSKHSLLSPKQFGFQRGKSTLDALISLTDFIYGALNSRKHTLSVFVDLRKAFDTVQHKILLHKLHLLGIRGLPLELLNSYLFDRKQCVKIGNTKSNLKTISIGVPQSSILSPILFLLYVNDFPMVSDKLSSVIFADDTSISLTDSDQETLVDNFNSELIGVKRLCASKSVIHKYR